MQTNTEPSTRIHRGQTAAEGSQRSVSREVRDEQPSIIEQRGPRRISLKNDAVRAHSCSYHRRGAGWVPRENNVDRERRERHNELGVQFMSRSSRHDELWRQREIAT